MILWARREDNPEKWHRPLDAISQGAGIAIVNDIAVFANIYRPHLCPARLDNPARPEAMEIAQAEQGDRYRDYQNRDINRRQVQMRMDDAGKEVAYQIAAAVDCRICKVDAGEYCINMNLAKRGKKEYTQWPHLPRFAEGETVTRIDIADCALTRFSTSTYNKITSEGIRNWNQLEKAWRDGKIAKIHGLSKRGQREISEFMTRMEEGDG